MKIVTVNGNYNTEMVNHSLPLINSLIGEHLNVVLDKYTDGRDKLRIIQQQKDDVLYIDLDTKPIVRHMNQWLSVMDKSLFHVPIGFKSWIFFIPARYIQQLTDQNTYDPTWPTGEVDGRLLHANQIKYKVPVQHIRKFPCRHYAKIPMASKLRLLYDITKGHDDRQ